PYENTVAVATTVASGSAVQMPNTWCQFKSRALAEVASGLKKSRVLNAIHLRTLGSQRYMPLTTKKRKARLLAPVIARAASRPSPPTLNQRCQPVVAL